MKKRLLVTGIMLMWFCTTATAQNGVTVIPLNSNKVAGNDRQVQYNDDGKLAGGEVYCDKATGYVGVGTSNPQSPLHVIGYIQIPYRNGNPPDTDCSSSSHTGRMTFNSVTDTLFICSGISGWVQK